MQYYKSDNSTSEDEIVQLCAPIVPLNNSSNFSTPRRTINNVNVMLHAAGITPISMESAEFPKNRNLRLLMV